MGGQSGGDTALGVDDPYVERALTVGGEGYLAAVLAPYGVGVVGRVGGQLSCLSACSSHAEEVALVAEYYCLAVGRDGRKT